MKLKIRHRGFADNRVLEVNEAGVIFTEASGFSKTRKFRFDEILLVLVSPENALSFQAGADVFSVPTKPDDAEHRATVKALLAGLRATVPPGLSHPPDPCPTSASES